MSVLKGYKFYKLTGQNFFGRARYDDKPIGGDERAKLGGVHSGSSRNDITPLLAEPDQPCGAIF